MDGLHHISIDIETYSDVDIKKAGLYKYAESPAFSVLLFAYSIDGGPVQVVDLTAGDAIPQDVVEAMYSTHYIKHAYNAAFEIECLSRYFGSALPTSQWRCTMLHGRYVGYPGNLDAVGKALGLSEDKQKMAAGKALIRYFCKPCKPTKANGGRTRNLPQHDPARWDLFKAYNAQDVVTEMEIERRLSSFPVPEAVQLQWELDLQINRRGVAVDMELVQGALALDANGRTTLLEEARKLTGLDNPNSVGQLIGWLREQTGEDITTLTKDDVSDLLVRDDLPGDVLRVLEIRQELGKTSNKKYTALDTAACSDNRVRGLLQFYGASRSGRWSGRLIQPQNLPRTYIDGELLPLARDLVKRQDAAGLRLVYGPSVADTLSQLIRTTLCASPGALLVDADFSAIEARMIAWLAGEEWVLDVFRTHGKIYEAAASQMFGVPFERIKKGNPEYAYRQKGKVATLALGYQGGTNALINMGALRMGIPEEDLQDVVDRWRQANSRIVQFWWDLDAASKHTVQTGRTSILQGGRIVLAREIDKENDLDFLTIRLPSGRKLYYAQPHMGQDRFGRPSICYMGINQYTSKWERIETYGGKLAENCLCGDTLVLTPDGWKRMELITTRDKVWDGLQWVSHDGLISKGTRPVISVDGVRMTPDHKIYTGRGWKYASSSKRYYRHKTKLPDGHRLRWIGWEEIAVADQVRLWERVYHAFHRVPERETEVLRLHAQKTDWRRAGYASALRASDVPCLAVHETTLPKPNGPGREELWRARNLGVRPLGKEFRKLLGGYARRLSPRSVAGQDRRQRGLLPGKLSMGNGQGSSTKQAQHHSSGNPHGYYAADRGIRKVWNWGIHFAVSGGPRRPGRYVVHKTGRHEQVYDLRNCGPNQCFTVMSDAGPMLVHNCTQAVARDCLAEAITRLEQHGYHVVFHVHDEVIIDRPRATEADLDRVVEIMSEVPDWAEGLPLAADGWVDAFFKKD